MSPYQLTSSGVPTRQHYEVFVARGREIVGGPVGTAATRDNGDIAVETGVFPVGPNFHLVLRPAPAGETS